jgi:hypothetical protein
VIRGDVGLDERSRRRPLADCASHLLSSWVNSRNRVANRSWAKMATVRVYFKGPKQKLNFQFFYV